MEYKIICYIGEGDLYVFLCVFQQVVFDDLGRGVLDNAWKGYNCSLFAYGQTGSGKSYSMVGYGANKGIVPIFCDELFKAVEEKRAGAGPDEEYQVRGTTLYVILILWYQCFYDKLFMGIVK